jgi:hypothetical protein
MAYPALRLLWSPGNVLALRHQLHVGQELAVPKTGLTLGKEGDVQERNLRDVEYFLGHELEFRTRDNVMINGRATGRTTLRHRDLLELKGGVLFRVLQREDVEARSPTLEAAITGNPDDDEVVQVWRDFLLDHGDPLGERIAKARAGEDADDGQWLDTFAKYYEMSRLDVTWRNGLAHRVVLRDAEEGFGSLKHALERLFSVRVMRFLRELVIDVSSDRLEVKDGLKALAAVSLPPSLRTLSLGDVPETYRHVSEAALATFGRPVQVGYFTGARLEVVTSKVPHFASGEQLALGDDGFHFDRYHIQRDGQRYRLSSGHHGAERPRIRGRPVDALPLRDGDEIEMGPELSVRFTLVR